MGKLIHSFTKNRQGYSFAVNPMLYGLLSNLEPPSIVELEVSSLAMEPSHSDSESGGNAITPQKSKTYTFQTVSQESETWAEYIGFLNQRCSPELEALELYQAIVNFESRVMTGPQRKEVAHQILFEYLGFNGGDKLVTISSDAMLELSASVDQFSESEIPVLFFLPAKKELCEQIEASFVLSLQQSKKR
eukprot:TRINITY_DN4941_c0_g1_i2.p1 TRINITY_DN4941_c0_g1~~TRINITY_DN4941_c0_g1_i2.p1  ORF type:complete len:190 (-),score=30.58 TRINITY_DN4941_c0_g1_i2:24-593(-)